jgi:RimJ/RimL family protein N-acetyltransferase
MLVSMDEPGGEPAIQPAYRISTDRLELRCYQPADLPAMRASVEQSHEHLRPWMPWAHGELDSFDAQLALLRRWRAAFDEGREFVYGAFEPAGGECVGSVGLHARAGPGALEMGYWVRVDRAGQGYGTEMAAAASRVCFELLRLEFVEIRCEPTNAASAAIPRKLGYTCDGVLRRRLPWPDGERRDQQIWSLFADEYVTSPCASAVLAAYDALDRRLL